MPRDALWPDPAVLTRTSECVAHLNADLAHAERVIEPRHPERRIAARFWSRERARTQEPDRLSEAHETREATRTVRLNCVAESQFVPVVLTAVVLDLDHLNGGVEPVHIA